MVERFNTISKKSPKVKLSHLKYLLAYKVIFFGISIRKLKIASLFYTDNTEFCLNKIKISYNPGIRFRRFK